MSSIRVPATEHMKANKWSFLSIRRAVQALRTVLGDTGIPGVPWKERGRKGGHAHMHSATGCCTPPLSRELGGVPGPGDELPCPCPQEVYIKSRRK